MPKKAAQPVPGPPTLGSNPVVPAHDPNKAPRKSQKPQMSAPSPPPQNAAESSQNPPRPGRPPRPHIYETYPELFREDFKVFGLVKRAHDSGVKDPAILGIDHRRLAEISKRVKDYLKVSGLAKMKKKSSPPAVAVAAAAEPPPPEKTFSMVEQEEATARAKEDQFRKSSLNPTNVFTQVSLVREGDEEEEQQEADGLQSRPTTTTQPSSPATSEIFGGLVLGLGGQKAKAPGTQTQGAPPAPSTPAPTRDYAYHGIVFREGVNLASEYPEGGQVKMTPYCVPNTKRIRQMTRPYTDVGLHFSPAMTARFGNRVSESRAGFKEEEDKRKGGGGGKEEVDGEGDGTTAPNVFVMFGKPNKVKAIDCPPLFATTYQLILDYLDEHNLEELLQHLLALCLIKSPENPFEFISEHVGKMADARTNPDKYAELARIFYPDHLHAMFRVFDKEENGYVNLQQYHIGMEALGLTRYTLEPVGYKTDTVTEETFVKEGSHGLEILLKTFLS